MSDWFQRAQELFDWSVHEIGNPDCKGCGQPERCIALEAYSCPKEGCPGLVHQEYSGEGYDEESNDVWDEYIPCCDVCERRPEAQG